MGKRSEKTIDLAAENRKAVENLLTTKHGRYLLRELVAEVIHDAWCHWSKNLVKEEKNISSDRLKRWEFLWAIPYCQIPDDRKPEYQFAERILTRLGLKIN